MLTLEAAVVPSEDAVFRELDGQAVLLNLSTGMYFGLDAVGTHVWRLASENGSLRWISERLAGEYEAPAETIERDLLTLADALVTKGLWAVR